MEVGLELVRVGPNSGDFEQFTQKEVADNELISTCVNHGKPGHESNMAFINEDEECPLCVGGSGPTGFEDPDYDEQNSNGWSDNIEKY